jgi:hypothetical protein
MKEGHRVNTCKKVYCGVNDTWWDSGRCSEYHGTYNLFRLEYESSVVKSNN